MELQKILFVAVVAVVLSSCIDCKISERRCPRPDLVLPTQTCTSDKNCFSRLCCPNKHGKTYCTTGYKTITIPTDKSKRRGTKAPSVANEIKTAVKDTAVEFISQLPKLLLPYAIDAAKKAMGYKPTDNNTVVTMRPGKDSLGDGNPIEPQGNKIPPTSQHLVVTQKSGAGVVEGKKIMMLTIISASVILSYI